tara:strand:- start:519 stop:659 length:141 start_codon:yes stop_codon:yes gene_type:complete
MMQSVDNYLVDVEVRSIANLLQLASSQVIGTYIPQQQVIISAAFVK